MADATIYCPPPGSIWRHRKGGTYSVLTVARVEATLEHVVVYHKVAQPSDVWTRPVAEFMDGRFTPLPELPTEAVDAQTAESERIIFDSIDALQKRK